ncbi:unnamed protein product [Rhizophagus irregularis]|nr:unnamed protein product [Rhizophagus irregularis]
MQQKKNKKNSIANHMMIFISLIAVINDFAKSSSSKNNINSQKFSKMFKKLQVKNDSQEDYNNKKTMKHHSCIDDEDEVHNNPNLHSEEQNELEIPDDI